MADIFPALRYQDAPGAIEWLCQAFGFERLFVVDSPDGTVSHAELRLGRGVVMIGSTKSRGVTSLGVSSPTILGGSSASIYVRVDDPDLHCGRAMAAGAEIVIPLKDMDYGSREYTARDPEGHLWSFGSYAPQI